VLPQPNQPFTNENDYQGVIMATSFLDRNSTPTAARLTHKLRREIARPMRQLSQYLFPTHELTPATSNSYTTGAGANFTGFHPQQATVEPEGIPLVTKLVQESAKYPGPIIEIGTLLGITTTTMALAKQPSQKIITVDLYCWNPWGLTPEVHEALAGQMLHYLVQTGHVERVRMDKNAFFDSYRGPTPSLVFLDAIHDYPETKKDIEWAKRSGAKIIAGHDYCDQFPGVKQIVDECGGPKALGGTVWVL
jgi:hypothetical protein